MHALPMTIRVVVATTLSIGCVVAASIGCSSESSPATELPAPIGSSAPSASSASTDRELRGGVHETPDETRVLYSGRRVDASKLTVVRDAIMGLPVIGELDVTIDIRVPKRDGRADPRKAIGVIEIACAGTCQLGDDKTHLKPPGRHAFAGDGFKFGHIALERFAARVEIGNGHAKLVRWDVASPDIDIGLRASVQLGSALDRSWLDGCLHFRPKPALRARDRDTDAVLLVTGAPRDPNGMFNIKLAGTPTETKRLAVECSL